MRRDVWPALGLLVAGWVLTLTVTPWSNERINDLGIYRHYADAMLSGGLPFRDFLFEYPPLSAPVVGLPGVFGTGYDPFRISFAVAMLVLAAAVLLLVALIADRTGGDRRRALYGAALMPLLCGALVRTHFDLAPTAVMLAALALLLTGRPRLGLAMIGVGVVMKGFPLVLAPIALAWLVGLGRRRDAWQGALACAAVIVVVSGATFALSPGGARDTLRYQLDRPVQVESTPAVGLWLLDTVGLGDAEVRTSFGSEGLHHPAAGAFEAIGLALLLAALGLLTAAVSRSGGEDANRRLALACLGAVVAFAAFGKVLSPQFLIWMYPLGVLAFAWRMPWLAAAIALAVLLTFVEFPAHYFDYIRGVRWVLVLVGARDLALIAAVGLVLGALLPRGRQDLLDRRRPAVAAGLD